MDITYTAAARHLLGLTAAELARDLDMDPRTIRRYEAGTQTPPASVLVDLDGLLAEHAAQAAGEVPADPARPRGWHVALAARRL